MKRIKEIHFGFAIWIMALGQLGFGQEAHAIMACALGDNEKIKPAVDSNQKGSDNRFALQVELFDATWKAQKRVSGILRANPNLTLQQRSTIMDLLSGRSPSLDHLSYYDRQIVANTASDLAKQGAERWIFQDVIPKVLERWRVNLPFGGFSREPASPGDYGNSDVREPASNKSVSFVPEIKVSFDPNDADVRLGKVGVDFGGEIRWAASTVSYDQNRSTSCIVWSVGAEARKKLYYYSYRKFTLDQEGTRIREETFRVGFKDGLPVIGYRLGWLF